MAEIHIVAQIRIKEEHKNSFLSAFDELVKGSRAEEGNIRYDLMADLTDPLLFMVIETWASARAIDFHNETEHFKKFVKFADGKTDAMSVNHLTQLF